MKLAIGTVQFGLPYGVANKSGQVSRNEAKMILELARSTGIETLDTAIAYGDSETCLGEVGVEGFKVVTKLPALPEDLGNVDRWVRDQVRSSFDRLGVQRVYGLLLHRSQQLVGSEGKPVVKALERLKAEGLVQKIGVSIYSPAELETVTQACAIDLIQAPFNLIDHRLYTSGWLQKMHEAGVEIHARSLFLQGLLLMPRAEIPGKFAPWSSFWDIWHDWLAMHQISAAHACISFVQSFPQIDFGVVGVDSKDHLLQIIEVASKTMDAVLPNLMCTDERLIDPSNWKSLETL